MSLSHKKKCCVQYSLKHELGDILLAQKIKHLRNLLWWQGIKVSLGGKNAVEVGLFNIYSFSFPIPSPSSHFSWENVS